MSAEHPELLWCVEFKLDTYMWNEGFEVAKFPWCKLYTDNAEFVENLPDEFDHPEIPMQSFSVKKYQTVMPDVDEQQTKFIDGLWDEDDADWESDRFLGYVSGTAAEIQGVVADRILKFGGI